MTERKNWINTTDLDTLNKVIYQRGHLDREDILSFLRLVDTTDAKVIIEELRKWMKALNDDPKYDKVLLIESDINAVIGDLDSYGVVQNLTILKLKEDSARNMQ